jgi:hypothetical protein
VCAGVRKQCERAGRSCIPGLAGRNGAWLRRRPPGRTRGLCAQSAPKSRRTAPPETFCASPSPYPSRPRRPLQRLRWTQRLRCCQPHRRPRRLPQPSPGRRPMRRRRCRSPPSPQPPCSPHAAASTRLQQGGRKAAGSHHTHGRHNPPMQMGMGQRPGAQRLPHGPGASHPPPPPARAPAALAPPAAGSG